MNSMKEWLESLKDGDDVLITFRHEQSISKVTKVTKTKIVVGSYRFNKNTGMVIGETIWRTASISEVTENASKDINRINLYRKLTAFRFSLLTLDQLERIQAIIDEGKK